MGKTPDRSPGVRKEEGLIMRDDGVFSSVEGELRYHSNRWSLCDAAGEYDPRAGNGVSELQHDGLDTLAHDVAEDSYLEALRTDGRVSSLIWWTDSGKTKRIRDTAITRTSGRISQVVTRQYDGAGALIIGQTITEVITRTGGRISSMHAVES